MNSSHRRLPWWTWVVPGLIAHLGTEISRVTAIAPGVSAMYLPIPFGIAMICWWGPRILPAFYLNAVLSAGIWGLSQTAFFPIYALPETLAVLAGWWLFRLGRGRCALPQLSDALKFVALVALPAAVFNSLILGAILVQLGDLPVESFWRAAWAGGTGTLLDSLTIAAPLLVLLSPALETLGWSRTTGSRLVPFSMRPGDPRLLLAESLAVFGAVLMFSLAVPLESFWSVYLLFVLWAAIRHGFLMALLANVWIALLAVLLPAVLHGTAAFPGTALFNLQAALVLVCLTGLVVGRAIADQQASLRQREESDRALAESEAFLRLAQRAGRAGAWEWDLGSDRFKWSEELAAIHGIALHEFDGQPATLIEFCHPDDRPRLVEVMRQVREGEELSSIECRMTPRSGGEIQMLWTGQIVRRDDGAPHRVLGVATDVSDRKRAEDALVQSEERMRMIIREQTEYIVKWLPDGTRTFVNEAYCRAFGVTEAECIGTSFFPLVVPEYREELLAKIRTLTPEHPEATDEHLSYTAAGEQRWQQWTERGLFNAQGELVELLSTGRDVTERRRAEETLRELASRYKAILESSLDAVIVIDAQSTVLEFNAAAEELFGYRRDAVIGRTMTDLIIPPELRGAHNAGVARYLASGEGRIFGQRVEMPAMRADGSQVRVELAVNVIAGTSPPLFAGVVRDITPRLKLEDQLRQSQKMEAVGRLAGGIAHDFNNLLTIITGYASLLEDEIPAGDSRREMVDGIQQAARQSTSLTRQLLAFSRRQVLTLKPLDLNAVVEDVCKILGRLIGEDVMLCNELEPALQPVLADAGQIEQVLLNLAVNARDAMEQGGQLTITTANAVKANGERQVVLTVRDTGRGMTPEVQQQIFEPFFTTKDAGKGTGLGLSVVHGIVSQLGGQIEVESAPGAGATFRVYLPVAAEASAPEQSPQLPVHRGSGTVLVVEDEPALRALTGRVLREAGYQVHEAGSGEAALVIASDGTQFDLLITDVVMPGMSGRELGEHFAALQPQARILYVSGYTDDAVLRHGVEHQQVNFLQKPFTPRSLGDKVREVMA